MIKEFDRICRKYNLRWFTESGTLLGAARHGGFIPWDDDVDIAMLRPDYAKFQQVAAKELQEPYFLEVWCNYALEYEGVSEQLAREKNLQFISREDEPNNWKITWPKMRIRDSRTMVLGRYKVKNVNFGIWIDIFPYDPAPTFDKKEDEINFLCARELTFAALRPIQVDQAIKDNVNLVINRDQLQQFVKLPLYMRGAILDDFQARNFSETKFIARTVYLCLSANPYIWETSDVAETIYLPFEKITVPAPKNYDKVLTAIYGDWRKFVFAPPHAQDWSLEISYAEYLRALKP